MSILRGFAQHTTVVSDRTTWKVLTICSETETGYGEYSDSGDDTAADHLVRAMCGSLIGTDLDTAIAAVAGEVLEYAPGALPTRAQLLRRTVIGGLATALWDLRCRIMGRGFGSCFGAVTVQDIPVYANVNRGVLTRTPEEFADHAAAAVLAGFRGVKLAPFDRLVRADRGSVGLAAVQAVRERVGPDIDVMLDVHHVLTAPELRRIAGNLADLDLRWIEDAAPLDDLPTLRWLRDNVGVPLAGGELAANVSEVDKALRAGVLGYLLPDVKHSGGPQRVARLIAEADAAGAGISLHNPSGPVGTAASIHLCAALAPNSPLELMVGEAGDHRGPVLPVDRVVDGFLPVPGGDGLGTGLLAASAERDGKRVAG